MYCAISKRSCICSIISKFGTNFAEILKKLKSSVKIVWTDPILMLASFASSQIMIRRTYITRVPSLVNYDLISRPKITFLKEHASLFSFVWPPLKRLYYSFIYMMDTSSLNLADRFYLGIAKLHKQLNALFKFFFVIFEKLKFDGAYLYLLAHWRSCHRLTPSVGRKKFKYARDDCLHSCSKPHLPSCICFCTNN